MNAAVGVCAAHLKQPRSLYFHVAIFIQNCAKVLSQASLLHIWEIDAAKHMLTCFNKQNGTKVEFVPTSLKVNISE